VTQRTHEIGVLMALGAAPADVMWMVLRQGAWLAAIGIVSGLSGAFVSMRLLETLLFGIATTDALTFVAASSGIMLLVLLAASVPALRATRISPALALRCQ
jgi:ABC-type antimicrobial peptide transport system permease subunit